MACSWLHSQQLRVSYDATSLFCKKVLTDKVAVMARLVAGVRNRSLIATLPGSPKGAKENLEAVIKLLPHACAQAAGADSRLLHAGGVKQLEQEAGVAIASPKSGEAASKPRHRHHDHQCGHGHGHNHDSHSSPPQENTLEPTFRSNDPQKGPSRRHRASPYPMISVVDALKKIASNTPIPQMVRRTMDQSLVGLVLAEDLKATEAVPAFRASMVDGYALAVPAGDPSRQAIFPVTSVSHATPGETLQLKAGEVARITTGAAVPPGANAIVMVEDTVVHSMAKDGKEESEIEILTNRVRPGDNIREVGNDVLIGDVFLREGSEITASGGELGLLASVGIRSVLVYERPTVGVLSTGDELVAHDQSGELGMGQVRDCNRPALLAALNGLEFKAIDLGIVRDK